MPGGVWDREKERVRGQGYTQGHQLGTHSVPHASTGYTRGCELAKAVPSLAVPTVSSPL